MLIEKEPSIVRRTGTICARNARAATAQECTASIGLPASSMCSHARGSSPLASTIAGLMRLSRDGSASIAAMPSALSGGEGTGRPHETGMP